MKIPRLPTRRLVATAALVLAAAILISTGVGKTQATEPTHPQVPENSPGGTAISTPLNASATGGTVRYALSGTDSTNFSINPETGEISIAQGISPDYETKQEYSLTITATADITVQVTNVDEPGTVTLSTDEPDAGETIEASLADPDGDIANVQWSWAHFDGTNLSVIAGVSEASYTTTTADIGHRIAATARYDDAAATGQQATASTANPVRNDPPAFPDGTTTRHIDENAAAGTTVGNPVTATDPNGHLIAYSVDGDANFQVDPQSGQISVTEGATLDHETEAVPHPDRHGHGLPRRRRVHDRHDQHRERRRSRCRNSATRPAAKRHGHHRHPGGPGRQRLRRDLAVEQK